jgi:hypothetical protein
MSKIIFTRLEAFEDQEWINICDKIFVSWWQSGLFVFAFFYKKYLLFFSIFLIVFNF